MRSDENPLIGFSCGGRHNGVMRVLVVEDNTALADGVRRGLVAEGFDVDLSHDGLDGAWRAREFPYDAIVLDILLPGLNGYEVCRQLRADGIGTPILMLTAKDGELDEAEGLDLGADDYVTKPFSFTVLVARLRAVLRRSRSDDGASDLLIVGGLEVDPIRRNCTVDGRPVALTHREFSLLEALARRPGEPLTRAELFDRVWGADHPGVSNVVDVYVGYLRRKLDRPGSNETASRIETVRGIGYRVVAT
jgi:two-component system, OmpR family, response regulator